MRVKVVGFVRIVSVLMAVVLLFNSCIFTVNVSAEMTDVHREEIKAGLDAVTHVEDIVWAPNCVKIAISNIMMDDSNALNDYIASLEDIPKYSWVENVNTISVNEVDGVQYIIGAYIKVKEQYVNEDRSINKEQARIDGEAEQQAMNNLKDRLENGQFAEGLADVIAKTSVTSNRVKVDISSLGMTDDEVKGYGPEISKAVYSNEDCYWVSYMQLSGDAVTVYVKELYMVGNNLVDKEQAKSDYFVMKERLDNGELEDIIEEVIDAKINNMIDYYTSVILRAYIDNVYWMSGLTEHEFDVRVWKMREKTKYFFFEDLNLQCVDNRHYVYGFTWRGETDTGYEDWEITREKDIEKWSKLQVKAKGLYESLKDDRLTDLEKVLLIYDWLMREVEYDYENYKYGVIPRKSYSIKGVVVDGKIVCEGYADTMKYFLDYAGIDNYKVSGETGPDDEGHAWNVVKLDGKWYHLDATWDDNGKDELYEGEWEHTYFLLSDEEIKALDHNEWWNNEYDCTDSGSYEDYIFRYYGMSEVVGITHKGRTPYNYYDGYWYYAQNGTFYAQSIMKSKIDGSDSSVFKSFDEYIISSYIYEDYMYVATAAALYKVNMLDGSEEIILSKNSEWGADGYISEFVMKDNRLKIDICKRESDGTSEEYTEYIDLVNEEDTTVSIDQKDVTLNAGESSQLTITTNYAGTLPVKWWSMDVNILTVDADGVMSAKAEGEVVVMCAVNGAMSSTTVTVNPELIYGDANSDGVVDIRDAVVLKQYLAGMSGIAMNTDAADVDADGIVDLKDAVKIMQFLAGFDIKLGK